MNFSFPPPKRSVRIRYISYPCQDNYLWNRFRVLLKGVSHSMNNWWYGDCNYNLCWLLTITQKLKEGLKHSCVVLSCLKESPHEKSDTLLFHIKSINFSPLYENSTMSDIHMHTQRVCCCIISLLQAITWNIPGSNRVGPQWVEGVLLVWFNSKTTQLLQNTSTHYGTHLHPVFQGNQSVNKRE